MVTLGRTRSKSGAQPVNLYEEPRPIGAWLLIIRDRQSSMNLNSFRMRLVLANFGNVYSAVKLKQSYLPRQGLPGQTISAGSAVRIIREAKVLAPLIPSCSWRQIPFGNST